jgi:hypothetical protein
MSTVERARSMPQRGGGISANTFRIALITAEPLYREGMQQAVRQTKSLILLDATTIAEAIELAKSCLAELVVIEANSIGSSALLAYCGYGQQRTKVSKSYFVVIQSFANKTDKVTWLSSTKLVAFDEGEEIISTLTKRPQLCEQLPRVRRETLSKGPLHALPRNAYRSQMVER